MNRFVVLRSPEQRAVVAEAARRALAVIEPVYGLTRPAADDDSRAARTNRATYEMHDRAGELTAVLFADVVSTDHWDGESGGKVLRSAGDRPTR